LVQSGKKVVTKFELPETQFERTVKDKIASFDIGDIQRVVFVG